MMNPVYREIGIAVDVGRFSNRNSVIDSSRTTEATVPATVQIPANQTTASFVVIAVNDTVAD